MSSRPVRSFSIFVIWLLLVGAAAAQFRGPDQRAKTPTTTLGKLKNPVSVINGGRQCGTATPFVGLPINPPVLTMCGVTDSSTGCVAGTPVTAGGGSPSVCFVTWNGTNWMPAGGAISAATGGFSVAGTGLTGSGTTVSLATPVAATLGGTGADLHASTSIVRAGNPFTATTVTGTDTDTTIAKTGGDLSTANPSRVTSTTLTNPLPYGQGGSGCKATTFATLPVGVSPGTPCVITDANTCQVGSVISSGGGTHIPGCLVRWNGSNWIGSDVTATNPLLVGVPLTASNGIKAPSFTSTSAPVATTGLINDINNYQTIAAADVENDGNDIQEIASDNGDIVHVGGGGAKGVSIDNASIVSQGSMSSGAFQDIPANSTAFTGSTESCAKNVHNYTLSANATINLACTNDANNQHLVYFFTQPASGTTFYSYTFAASGGNTVVGDTPVHCAATSCIDYVTVDWIPINDIYIVTLVKGNIAGPGGGGPTTSCPTGVTCYYVDSGSNGSDSNDGLGPDNTGSHHPWKTIGKANEIVSSLNPGDQILFKSGATWLGTSGYPTSSPFNNHSFFLGDTTAHGLNSTTAGKITKATSIVIGTYGGTARALWDMQNLQSFCFATVDPSTNFPANAAPVKDIIMSNIECERAYQAGVWIDPTGTNMPNMQVVNMYIHNVGAGYNTSTTSCDSAFPLAGGNTEPPDWASGQSYPAQGPTASSMVKSGGKGFFTKTACTSGGSASFPGSCTYQTAVTTGDSGCNWTCAGIAGLNYVNALQYLDTTHAQGGGSVTFKGNTVSCSGGHNLLEVEGDRGSPFITGNTIGPGGIHGGIDLKVSGDTTVSPATVATISGNTVTCGALAGHCGCAQSGGGSCATGQTPSLFTEDYLLTMHSNYIFYENTVYDAYVGVQDIVAAACNPSVTDCTGECTSTGTGDCPSNEAIYNNSIYLNPSSSTICVYAGGGNGNKGSSQIDVRNNICDGTKQLFTVPTGNSGHAWNKTTEDYNDLGGAQGFTNAYSFNGSGTPGSHDYCPSCSRSTSTDPSYVSASSVPPNLNLNSGSIAKTIGGVNAGTTLPTPPGNNGNFCMGAFC